MKSKKHQFACALILTGAVVASASHATPVDLSSWIENGRPDNNAGNWTVQGVNNDSVFQSVNGNPTIFFSPGANSQGTELGGNITVETTGDDDFIGFVLGYQDGEINSVNADFWLVDWKQGDQGPAVDGLALSKVSGDLTGTDGSSFGGWWNHQTPIEEVQRATNLGSTGWEDNRQYDFDITFTSSLIEVKVDGITEISYSGMFTDGSFGFYNFSQQNVRYGAVTQVDVPQPPGPAPIPLPLSLPLLGAGLVMLRLVGHRKTAE